MIKTCSLDFLNREIFETDVMTEDGRVLVSADQKVTPEMVLKLYFRDIYVDDNYLESGRGPRVVEAEIVENVVEANFEVPNLDPVGEEQAVPTAELQVEAVMEEEAPAEEIVSMIIEEPDQKLEFDEGEAKRISENALRLGKVLGFSEKRLAELKDAAYYFNIGRTRFTTEDAKAPDFKKKKALAGYEILKDEMKMPEKVAETAKYVLNKYDSSSFILTDELDYYHIVSICSFYDNLLQHNHSKGEALDIMIYRGGNQFNIFVLHKFIKIMKESDEY